MFSGHSKSVLPEVCESTSYSLCTGGGKGVGNRPSNYPIPLFEMKQRRGARVRFVFEKNEFTRETFRSMVVTRKAKPEISTKTSLKRIPVGAWTLRSNGLFHGRQSALQSIDLPKRV